MKTSEIKKLSQSQLKKELLSYKKEQFNLRFQVANGQNNNASRFRLIRREIAAIKTIIHNNLMKVK